MGEHPVIGKIVFPFDGTVILPDFPSGGNGEEIYHWYQDGEDLSILVKDQKLNSALIKAQAWYRGGGFDGFILLDKTEPQADEPIMVFPREDHIPFKSGGLAKVGMAYGSGWYANGEMKDAVPTLVQWLNFGLQFLVPKSNGKLSRVKADFPSDWGGYGLFLSWSISVP